MLDGNNPADTGTTVVPPGTNTPVAPPAGSADMPVTPPGAAVPDVGTTKPELPATDEGVTEVPNPVPVTEEETPGAVTPTPGLPPVGNPTPGSTGGSTV